MVEKLKVTASVATADGERQIVVGGQKAKALQALVDAGSKGITALEAATWAFRLAAYCHFLCHDNGLNIICKREDHPGGWHGRHVLLDKVTILNVAGDVGGRST